MTLPVIQLHSDLHLETGPFNLEPPTRPAILVLAGDIHPGPASLGLMRALSSSPVVAVAGNHEFWGGDYFETLAALRREAPAQNIHFLENSQVVQSGIRFVGATLWTDYLGGHPQLMRQALYCMRDFLHIKAAAWWTASNKKRFLNFFGQEALSQFEGNFNPLLARALNRRSTQFFQRALALRSKEPTVAVTHHAPAYDALLHAGLTTQVPDPSTWHIGFRADSTQVKLGTYASDTLATLRSTLLKPAVHLWCHGHLHAHLRYAVHGIQLACNARGRARKPLTEADKPVFALSGLQLTNQDIAQSKAQAKANPEQGDNLHYKKDFELQVYDTGYAIVAHETRRVLAKLDDTLAELRALAPISRSLRRNLALLAAHRSDTLFRESIALVQAYASNLAKQLTPWPSSPQQNLLGALHEFGLGSWRQFGGLEYLADTYPTCDPKKHVQYRAKLVRTLRLAVQQTERACALKRTEFLHN